MDIYHVDIMDGTFVPNFGMSVRELNDPAASPTRAITSWLTAT